MSIRCLVFMPSNENGFSIMELLVGMVIFSIIGYTSVAFFSDLGPSFDRWNANIYALQDLRYAQTLAITEGCRVIVRINSDGHGYDVGCDYLAYDYTSPYTADTIFLTRAIPNTVTFGSDYEIIFNAKGQCVSSTGDLATRRISLTSSASGNFLTASILPTGVVVET